MDHVAESMARGLIINQARAHKIKKAVGFLAAHGFDLQDKEQSTHGQTSTAKIKIIALPGLIVYHSCHSHLFS
jgi:hypothetical protein